MKFVHLHTHSHYSLLDGLGKIPELVSRAKELGMEALALTDHGNMYGAIEFYEECVKKGIKPIIGMEAYLALEGRGDRRPKIDSQYYHLTLLAQNMEGYRNLMLLSSKSYLEGFYYKPRIDKELLAAYHGGIIALSGCLHSEVSKAIQSEDMVKAERLAREYSELFGEGNFYLEVQDHSEIPLQTAVNERTFELSARTGIPTAATKDCHYINKEDAEAQDLLLCIQMGKTVDDPTRMSMRDADYSLSSPEEMGQAFPNHPEAVTNTFEIAEKCSLKLDLNKWNFPVFAETAGRDANEYLRDKAYKGLEALGVAGDAARARLDYELDIIAKKGYATYFLVVADYVIWSRQNGIIATTRGSAAGSLVSYAIGVTTVNPLDYNLPFERFLNPYRPSPPDIDVDFADNRRDEVYKYVIGRYGRDKVAQICTFGTMAARGAVRDVARALGYPYSFGDKVAKNVPMGSQGFPMTLERALKESSELGEMYKAETDVRRVIDLAMKLEGCARHVSVHAAGVVISPTPLTDFTPLQLETGGDNLITQYEMGAVEKAGVLKMDFLGIRNLSILGRAVELVRKTKGKEIDLLRLPLDDKKTFELLARGDTIGLFQLNGSGMTRYLKELRPSSIFDIMAMVALYRPGPIDSIPEYIRRKHNPRLVKYLEPRMKDILQMSYGIITYQDDVLLIAINIAGYNWEEADKFRKAIGKKIPEEMAKQKEKFRAGCLKNNVSEEIAAELWALIEPFAAYGFNKAHAASYAMVAYQTAYMKANFPAEFMTAVMIAEEGDLEKIAEAVAECRRMGIEVLPPDINQSNENFTYIDDTHVRFGFMAIKNLGADVVGALVSEREAGGKFSSLADFASRLLTKYFNKRSLEALIKSGAMDSLGERNSLLSNLNDLQEYNKDIQRQSDNGQANLFSFSPGLGGSGLTLRHVPPAGKQEMLVWEKELLGLYVTEHPFTQYAETAKDRDAVLCSELKGMPKGSECKIGGIVAGSKRILTKKNETMLFAKIEDGTGTIEAIIFPRVYSAEATLWEDGTPLLLSGKMSEKDEELRFIVEKAEKLNPGGEGRNFRPEGSGELPAAMMVRIEEMADPHFFEDLRRLLIRFPGNKQVVLLFPAGAEAKKVETNYRVADTPELRTAIEQLAGMGSVILP